MDPAQVLALAEKTYGKIPARAVPPRKPQQEPAQQGPRRIDYKAPADTCETVEATYRALASVEAEYAGR